MVSDEEIASRVDSLLRLFPAAAAVSADAVVRQLESDIRLDLSHKKDFIQHRFDLFFGAPQRAQKDHFARTSHAQFHQGTPLPHPHHFQIPHHQQLAFGYTPPPQPPSIPAAAVASASSPTVHRQLHQQKQQQQHQQQQQQIASSSSKESASTGVKRRGGPGGLNKVCGVSPELQAIVGEPTMARTQIVKQLWAYIRKNNLQDPSNKRKIICNDELRLVFETDCTDMFKMNKLLAKHIITLEPTKDSGPNRKKLKVAAEEAAVSATERDAAQNPVAISDALANFFGTEEREMLQTEASKRVWDYIKDNQLEDAMNPMVIFCDSKLQQLFGCESISALGISEMLARHLFKQS